MSTPVSALIPATDGPQATSPGDKQPNTPTPPLTGLPVEHVPGGWGDYPVRAEHDALDKDAGYDSTAALRNLPAPIIGTVPYGGVVQSAESIGIVANGTVTIGDKGNGRLRVMAIGLALYTGTLGAVVALQPDGQGDAPANGFPLPLGVGQINIVWLNVRRATLRNLTGAAISLGVVIVGYQPPSG